MSLKVAFLKEPIDFDSSLSTLSLMAGVLNRGYKTYHFTPANLILKDGVEVFAKSKVLESIDFEKKIINYGKEEIIDLKNIDVVSIRTNPPFDMAYYTCLSMLEMVLGKTFITNNPSGIKNFPEKLFPFDFSKFSPPTIIASDIEQIANFINEHGDAIIKPLYQYGGKGVFFVNKENRNISKIHKAIDEYSAPMVAQKYLPEIKDGSKRLVIIDGNLIGGVRYVPSEGSVVSNITSGGSSKEYELTKRDVEICDSLIPELDKRGILLCGVDIVGEYVIEINVTAPAGLLSMKNFLGIDAVGIFWDAVESKL